MDDLLNIATKTMEGFNPATDPVDNYEEIADGVYTCLLQDVKHNVSKESGNHRVTFKYEIIEGDNEGRLIFVNYFFSEKTIERSIKGLNKLAYEFGFELPVDAFSDYDTLAETLNNMAGLQATVEKKTSKNDFVNYKVTPMPF